MKKLILSKFLMVTLAITLTINSVQAAAREQSWWHRSITAVTGCCSRSAAMQSARNNRPRRSNVARQNQAPTTPWLQTRKGKCALAVAALASIAAGGYFLMPIVGIGGLVSHLSTTYEPLELPIIQTESTLSKVPSKYEYAPFNNSACNSTEKEFYEAVLNHYTAFADYSEYNNTDTKKIIFSFDHISIYMTLKPHIIKMPDKVCDALNFIDKQLQIFDYLKQIIASNKICTKTLCSDWANKLYEYALKIQLNFFNLLSLTRPIMEQIILNIGKDEITHQDIATYFNARTKENITQIFTEHTQNVNDTNWISLE